MSPEISLHSVVLLIRPKPIHSSIQGTLLTGLCLVSSLAINIDPIAPLDWLNSTSRSSGSLCMHHLRLNLKGQSYSSSISSINLRTSFFPWCFSTTKQSSEIESRKTMVKIDDQQGNHFYKHQT